MELFRLLYNGIMAKKTGHLGICYWLLLWLLVDIHCLFHEVANSHLGVSCTGPPPTAMHRRGFRMGLKIVSIALLQVAVNSQVLKYLWDHIIISDQCLRPRTKDVGHFILCWSTHWNHLKSHDLIHGVAELPEWQVTNSQHLRSSYGSQRETGQSYGSLRKRGLD